MEEVPKCMGNRLPNGEWGWDPQNVECSGGPDPAFINQATGTNERPKCKWFAQCAAMTNAKRLAESSQASPGIPRPPAPTANVPVQQGPMAAVARGIVQGINSFAQQPQQLVPVRPPMVPAMPPAQQAPARVPPAIPMMPPQPMYQYPQQMPQPYGQMMVPPQAAMMPQAVPMNAMVGPLPGLLVVPEPFMPGQHWGMRLFYNTSRSALMAATMAMANFFAYNTFNPFDQNGG